MTRTLPHDSTRPTTPDCQLSTVLFLLILILCGFREGLSQASIITIYCCFKIEYYGCGCNDAMYVLQCCSHLVVTVVVQQIMASTSDLAAPPGVGDGKCSKLPEDACTPVAEKSQPENSLLHIMKTMKPQRLSARDADMLKNMKAIQVPKTLVAHAMKSTGGEFMVLRDYNIRAISTDSKVAVVLKEPSDDDHHHPSKPVRSGKARALPVVGYAYFGGNLLLQDAGEFSKHQQLHDQGSEETDFDAVKASFRSGRCLVGWHFTRFTLLKEGVQFVPSTSGNQDIFSWLLFGS